MTEAKTKTKTDADPDLSRLPALERWGFEDFEAAVKWLRQVAGRAASSVRARRTHDGDASSAPRDEETAAR